MSSIMKISSSSKSDARNKLFKKHGIAQLPFPDAIPREKKYIEFDNDFGLWAIFGNLSGHCYSQYFTKEEAKKHL